jgi:hypothetical protein
MGGGIITYRAFGHFPHFWEETEELSRVWVLKTVESSLSKRRMKMATKKSVARQQARSAATPPMPQSQAMSSGMSAPASPWKWVYLAGVFVAGLAGAFNFTALDPYLGWLLLLAGLLVGFLYFDSADVMNFGLRYLILWALANASPTFLGAVGMAESYVTGFLQGFFNFLGPVVLAQVIMHFSKKYFAK